MEVATEKAALLTEKLMRFYTTELFRLVIDITEHRTGRISLRLLDWLVTSYAKRHNSSFLVGDARVVIFSEYKAMLKSYSKCNFDPFCRRARIFVDVDRRACVCGPAGGSVMQTTNGQLNFFKWAVSRGVVVYAGQHMDAIEADLALYAHRPRSVVALHKHGYTCIDDSVTVTFE